MGVAYLTRRERFSAAHKLWKDDLSREENHDMFGKCSNPNWHGHNYELFVTVKGEPDPYTGFVVNLVDLKHLVKDKVINYLDHGNLNMDVPFMKGKMTTTEVLCIAVWDELVSDVKKMGADLHCIKIVETENNSFEYYG